MGIGTEGNAETLVIELPWPEPALWPNRSKGMHWSSTHRARKQQKQDAFKCAVTAKGWKPNLHWKAVKVDITFHAPDKRRRDWDNQIAAMKGAFDAVASAIKVDDSKWEVTFRKGEVRQGGVVVMKVTEA